MSIPLIGLTVSHLPTSSTFYLSTLQPLGFRYITHWDRKKIGFGLYRPDFYLTRVSSTNTFVPASLTFTAPDKIAVREFYAAALTAGGRPRKTPAYRENVFDAAVLDFDDNVINVVFDEEDGSNEHDDSSDYDEDVRDSRIISWCVDGVEQLDEVGRVMSTQQIKNRRTSAANKSAPNLAKSKIDLTKKASTISIEEIQDSDVSSAESPAVNSAPTLQRSLTDPIVAALTKAMGGDPTIDISANALAGTLLGVAAGATLGYAMCKSEQDSAQQELHFVKAMASRETKRRDSKVSTQDSPPHNTKDDGRRGLGRRPQLTIEAAPESDGSDIEYVSLSQQPRRHPLPRAATMPTSSTCATTKRKLGKPSQMSPRYSTSSQDETEERDLQKAASKHQRNTRNHSHSLNSPFNVHSNRNQAYQHRRAQSSKREGNLNYDGRDGSHSRVFSKDMQQTEQNRRQSHRSMSTRATLKDGEFLEPSSSSAQSTDDECDTILPSDSVSQIGSSRSPYRHNDSYTSQGIASVRPRSSKHSISKGSTTHTRQHSFDHEEISGSSSKHSSPRSSKKSSSGSVTSRSSSSKHRKSKSTEVDRVETLIMRPSEIEEVDSAPVSRDNSGDEDRKVAEEISTSKLRSQQQRKTRRDCGSPPSHSPLDRKGQPKNYIARRVVPFYEEDRMAFESAAGSTRSLPVRGASSRHLAGEGAGLNNGHRRGAAATASYFG